MADLSGLNLLRNDPVKAAEMIAEAERGDMDAQYAAGLIYAEGRGVPLDLVQAYYWLTLAVDQGDSDAELLRRVVAAQMSDDQFADGKHLVQMARRAREAGLTQGGGTRH